MESPRRKWSWEKSIRTPTAVVKPEINAFGINVRAAKETTSKNENAIWITATLKVMRTAKATTRRSLGALRRRECENVRMGGGGTCCFQLRYWAVRGAEGWPSATLGSWLQPVLVASDKFTTPSTHRCKDSSKYQDRRRVPPEPPPCTVHTLPVVLQPNYTLCTTDKSHFE